MARPASEEIIDLNTADLAELSPDELRSWIAHVIVHSMMGTPAGPRIDRERLQGVVQNHCDEMMAGARFDFSPILAALLRIPGVQEEDLYVGVLSLIGQLASMNIRMEEPAFKLTPLDKTRLIDVAYTDTQECREAYQQQRLRQAVHDLRRKRLGELLVEEGLVDEQQLVEGLEAQEELGGRLGSNLVRMGFLDEDKLAEFLGRQLGLPCITKLDRISPAAVRRVPKSIAERFEVVPVSIDERDIGVAMADPANLEAIDAVAFATGLRVRPAVAPEVLIQYALARFYGVRTRMRLRRLDLHRAKAGSSDLLQASGWSISIDLLTADVADKAPVITGNLTAVPTAPASSAPASPPVVAAPPEDGLSRLALDLAQAQDYEAVLEHVERFVSRHFATALLLEIDGTEARARFGNGIPHSPEGLSTIHIDVHQHPTLSDVFLRRGLFVGAEPEGHTWLCRVLSIPPESMLNILPLLQHDRVVGLLVGNARRRPCQDAVAEDQALAHIISTALSMVSLRRRLLSAARRGSA